MALRSSTERHEHRPPGQRLKDHTASPRQIYNSAPLSTHALYSDTTYSTEGTAYSTASPNVTSNHHHHHHHQQQQQFSKDIPRIHVSSSNHHHQKHFEPIERQKRHLSPLIDSEVAP